MRLLLSLLMNYTQTLISLAKINSPKVYIGPVENQQDPNNPAVKGEELVDTLGQIIDKFIQFLQSNIH
jgi:hypothetical protein